VRRIDLTKLLKNAMTQQNVDLSPCPAVSPDFSPIEHVWDEMERHLPNQPVTLPKMGPALIRIWNSIPQAFFNNLVRSMRRTLLTLLMSKELCVV
jgi:transposase